MTSLFPELPPIATTSGRHVHRIVAAPRKSPTGGVNLRYEYTRCSTRVHPMTRQSVSITPAMYDLVEQIVMLYFVEVGGFSKAGNALMKAALTALLEFGEQKVRIAIAAKAATLRGDKATNDKYRGDAVMFFGEKLDGHLQRSAKRRSMDAEQARQAAQAKQATRDREATRQAAQAEETLAHTALYFAAKPGTKLTDKTLATWNAYWNHLPADRRKVICEGVAARFRAMYGDVLPTDFNERVTRESMRIAIAAAQPDAIVAALSFSVPQCLSAPVPSSERGAK